ncbi:MAG: FKBP-type peptidyl-prolyl cis-trans isomerase [Bifidobacteriaceae bacterium]|nr:FKBP-type peptidyl-prolyl cis-trans isomerase [Bifidobacteriaceae bacterium]
MHNINTRIIAVFSAITLLIGLAACGSENADHHDQLSGIVATGELGKKPKVSFHTPMTVEDKAYAVLQKGNGKTINDGDYVCTHGIAYNTQTGAELGNSWTDKKPSCFTVNKKTDDSSYTSILIGNKVNTTIAIGVNDTTSTSSSSSSSTPSTYLMVLTVISAKKLPTRAEGTAVTDIPADLPKVTLDKNGKPSLDLNGYKPGDSLVKQTLIQGSGDTVESTDTITAQYSGWCLKDGKLYNFDSSWNRGTPSSFSLTGVVQGWTQGLSGQKVGSQVLLIIPPSLGYGDTETAGIPANSTLYFVVDILAVQK